MIEENNSICKTNFAETERLRGKEGKGEKFLHMNMQKNLINSLPLKIQINPGNTYS